ncbi:hypothetical protein ACFY0G_02180 [Streptomyces sp. NPDC001552]|uniref:hypothetical protein n=1 Tax=Streptomyces sp. NPDC001552 TaxID=3364587 RepID=UPI003686F2ED
MTNSANTPEPTHCTPVRGGKVHRMTNADLPTPFPGCRTGGSDHGGTQYRETSAPLTCVNCVATQAHLDAQPELAAEVEAPTAEAPAAESPAVTVVATLPGGVQMSVEAGVTGTWFITRNGHDLGTVRDEDSWSNTRGRWCAWSQRGATRRDGIVGFYGTRDEAARAIAAANPTGTTEAPSGEAPEAAPQWRTLKGLAVPFQLYGEDSAKGQFRPASDRTQVTGQPITIVRVWMEYGLRCVEDSTGRRINLYGLATKLWVTAEADPAAGLTEPQARAYAWLKAGNGWVTKQDGAITRAAFAGLVAAGLAVWTNNSPGWWGGRLADASPVWPGNLTAPNLVDPVTAFAEAVDEAAAAGVAEATPAPAAPTAQERPTMTDAMNRYLGREALLPRTTCAAEAARPSIVRAVIDGVAARPEAEPAADEQGDDWSAGERYTVEVEDVLAYPGYREDRITIAAMGGGGGMVFRLPHAAGRNVSDVLAAVGWRVRGSLEYIAGLNIERGRVERATPADTPAAEEMRAYFTDAVAAWKVIAAHADQVATNAHIQDVVRDGDVFPVGWTFRVGNYPSATYAAVTRSGSLDGLTGYATRAEARAHLLATCSTARTARGSWPRYAGDPDVRAALLTLDGLRLAELNEGGDGFGEAFGWMVQPRDTGSVAVYWLRGGQETDDGRPWAELEIARDRFASAGWSIDPMSHTFLVVGNAETDQARGRAVRKALASLATLDAPAEPAATAEESNAAACRAIVIEAHPAAERFEIHRATGGDLLGYTFQVGRLDAARYGWVTTAGTVSRSLERFRFDAVAMLPAQVADDQRVAERKAERAAAVRLPLKQAKRTAGKYHPRAREFRACNSPAGELVGYIFKTDSDGAPAYGWVDAGGTLGLVTERRRETIEDMLLKEAEFQARPVLARRSRDPQRDAVQLKALRQLLTRVRVISAIGDMEDVRHALGAYDEAMGDDA